MIQIYFVITGIGCLLYYGIIRHYTGKWNSTFAGFWLFAGLIHLSGLLLWNDLPDIVRLVCIVILTAFWLLFCIIEIHIFRGMRQKPELNADYLIVLGAHVNGRKITKSLMRRLDAAYRYLCENPGTKVIVSGGQGKGEAISEAEAMAENLLERGVGEERILMEDRSTTTRENLLFSQKIILEKCAEENTPKREPEETDERADKEIEILQFVPVVVVTNNFHIYRALLIGKWLGYRKLSGMSADSTKVLQVNYLVREFFAIILTKVRAML